MLACARWDLSATSARNSEVPSRPLSATGGCVNSLRQTSLPLESRARKQALALPKANGEGPSSAYSPCWPRYFAASFIRDLGVGARILDRFGAIAAVYDAAP